MTFFFFSGSSPDGERHLLEKVVESSISESESNGMARETRPGDEAGRGMEEDI